MTRMMIAIFLASAFLGGGGGERPDKKEIDQLKKPELIKVYSSRSEAIPLSPEEMEEMGYSDSDPGNWTIRIDGGVKGNTEAQPKPAEEKTP